jgi:hypothetical protein
MGILAQPVVPTAAQQTREARAIATIFSVRRLLEKGLRSAGDGIVSEQDFMSFSRRSVVRECRQGKVGAGPQIKQLTGNPKWLTV